MSLAKQEEGELLPITLRLPKSPGLLLAGVWCLLKEGGAGDTGVMQGAEGSKAAQAEVASPAQPVLEPPTPASPDPPL